MSTAVKLAQEIDEVLKNRIVNRHSFFQLKHFVIQKEPTHQRRMWRCLEELKVRHEGLAALKLQMDDTADNLQLAYIKIKMIQHDNEGRTKHPSPVFQEMAEKEMAINVRKAGREIERLEAALKKLTDQYHEQSEEAEFFLKAFKQLEKREKLRPFDDFDSQLEYWNERFAQALNTKVLLQLPLDTELIHSVLALPEGSPVRNQVMTLLGNQHKQFQLLKAKSEELPPNGDK
jgi:hypothetical protein